MFPGYPMLYVFFSRVACFQYNCPILSACFPGLSMLFENYSKGPMFSVCLPAVPRPLSQARCPKLALGTSCNLIGHCDVLKGYFLGLGLVHCTIGHTIIGLHEVLKPAVSSPLSHACFPTPAVPRPLSQFEAFSHCWKNINTISYHKLHVPAVFLLRARDELIVL